MEISEYYIAEIPEYYMQGLGVRGTVTLDDIRSLGEKYQNGNLSNKEPARDTWYPYLDKRSVNFFGKDNIVSNYSEYLVKDTDSIYACFIYHGNPETSRSSPYAYLKAQFMEYGIEIDGDMEKLTEYIESSKKIYEQVYENVAYIKEHLSDSQYGCRYRF